MSLLRVSIRWYNVEQDVNSKQEPRLLFGVRHSEYTRKWKYRTVHLQSGWRRWRWKSYLMAVVATDENVPRLNRRLSSTSPTWREWLAAISYTFLCTRANSNHQLRKKRAFSTKNIEMSPLASCSHVNSILYYTSVLSRNYDSTTRSKQIYFGLGERTNADCVRLTYTHPFVFDSSARKIINKQVTSIT